MTRPFDEAEFREILDRAEPFMEGGLSRHLSEVYDRETFEWLCDCRTLRTALGPESPGRGWFLGDMNVGKGVSVPIWSNAFIPLFNGRLDFPAGTFDLMVYDEDVAFEAAVEALSDCSCPTCNSWLARLIEPEEFLSQTGLPFPEVRRRGRGQPSPIWLFAQVARKMADRYFRDHPDFPGRLPEKAAAAVLRIPWDAIRRKV